MLSGKDLRMFQDAGRGIKIAWSEEKNFRIQIFSAGAAVGLSWILQISRTERAVVLLTIGVVLSAELFNTALEELCDMLRPTHDPHVGRIKDLAAGAVLVASWAALLVGLIIFLPHLAELL